MANNLNAAAIFVYTRRGGWRRRLRPGHDCLQADYHAWWLASAPAAARAALPLPLPTHAPTPLWAAGYMAHFLSRCRPNCPIYAFTDTQPVRQRLSMRWGVVPFLMPFSEGVPGGCSVTGEGQGGAAAVCGGEGAFHVSPPAHHPPPGRRRRRAGGQHPGELHTAERARAGAEGRHMRRVGGCCVRCAAGGTSPRARLLHPLPPPTIPALPCTPPSPCSLPPVPPFPLPARPRQSRLTPPPPRMPCRVSDLRPNQQDIIRSAQVRLVH